MRSQQLSFVALVFGLSRLLIFLAVAASPWFIDPGVPRWTLDDPLLRPLFRWDAGWYLNIAEYGYAYSGDPTKEHNIVFFPLYPLTCRLCHVVTGLSIPLCAFLLSNVAFFFALVALDVLTTKELGPGAARCAILLLAFFPTSLFFSTMYTESFYLVFSVLAYRYFRERRFIVGGIWGGLASATRTPGILLGVPLLFEGFSSLKDRRRWGQVILAGCLTISGLLAFHLYLWAAFSDPLANVHVQQHSIWQRGFALPFRSIAWGLKQAFNPTFTPFPFDAGFALLFGFVAAALPVYLPRSYAVYTLLSLAMPLFTTAGIASFSRYASVMFPVFMLLGLIGWRWRWIMWVLSAGFAVLLVIFSMHYAQWHWIG
jgi:hypothetical protein